MTQKKWIDIRQIIFPIGYVYISMNSTSPSSLFGGKWTPITGRFLYCNNGTKTGGSKTHSHTLDHGYAEINLRSGYTMYHLAQLSKQGSVTPDHGENHPEWEWKSNFTVPHSTYNDYTDTSNWGTKLTGRTDISQSEESLPPYQEVYAWQRVG